jgi:hemoglobin
MKDIQSEDDLFKLVNYFYAKLMINKITAPKFQKLDLVEHFPKIVSFWSLILFDKEGYKTNVFDKHLHLNISETHIEIWLKLFLESINELYEGEKAELAKQRGQVLAYTFSSKLKAYSIKNEE